MRKSNEATLDAMEMDVDDATLPSHIRGFTTVSGEFLRTERFHVLYRSRGNVLEPIVPLLQFFMDKGVDKRVSWQKDYATSVGLLLNHLEARAQSVDAAAPGALQRFVDDLCAGTIDDEGKDPLGLNWRGCSLNIAAAHLARVTEFADWVSERMGSQPLNPWRAAEPGEKIAQMRRFERKAAASLLAHAGYRQHEQQASRRARSVRTPLTSRGIRPVYAFDDAQFERFVRQGWSKPAHHEAPLAARFRLRDLMIVVLMHGGGLRLSECFHLYQCDVVENPDRPESALVHLFHPVIGAAPLALGRSWRDREHFLRTQWNLRPRNLEAGGHMKAGWKNLALQDSRLNASQVFWFPSVWGRVFWTLFRAYSAHRPGGRHPFLFTSERKGERGRPYSIKAFEQAYKEAALRAGLRPGKRFGTSPHAHRHAYGLRLENAHVGRLVIQEAMHHRSAISQDVYKQLPLSDIFALLDAASQRIDGLPAELLGEGK